MRRKVREGWKVVKDQEGDEGKRSPFIEFLSSPVQAKPNEPTINKINITKYSFSHVPVPPGFPIPSLTLFFPSSFWVLRPQRTSRHVPHQSVSVSLAFITSITICRDFSFFTRLHQNLV